MHQQHGGAHLDDSHHSRSMGKELVAKRRLRSNL
jgi:hypothetical protein